jgi:hypothetical protein
LVTEFEEKMRKLEKDGEELNRIKASIAAKKEARQRNRNYSARVRCHLTIICLPDYSSGYGLAQKIIEEFLRRPASELEVIEQEDSHGAGHTADASAAPEEP